MGEYRAYIIGVDGHFIGFEPLECANDAEAIEQPRDWFAAATLSFGAASAW
jgi:hypothetical protein